MNHSTPIIRSIAVISRVIACLGFAHVNVAVPRAEWPQFRGPNGSGVAIEAAPTEFGPGKNQLWRTPVSSGHSSPCVVDDAIFLTTFDSVKRKLNVVCISRSDGNVRWQRAVAANEIEKGHPSFNPASSSVASDGERVVAYFGSFGLICFDRKGEKQWEIPLPLTKSFAGNAISPIIVDDQVILYRGNYVDHYLLAVDKRTGKQLWKIEQSEKFTPDMSATAVPVAVGDALILHGVRCVQAFELDTGKQRWIAHCKTTATSTPVLAGDEIVVATWNQTGEEALTPTFAPYDELLKTNDKNRDGELQKNEFPKLMVFHRSEGTDAPQNGYPLRFRMVDTDKNGMLSQDEWMVWLEKASQRRKDYVPHGLIAIKINGRGTIDADDIRYLARDGIPEVPSPIVHDQRVFFVKNGGILTTVDFATGERLSRIRTKGRGTHYASPIIAGQHLYCAAGDGTISVLRLGERPEVIAVNKMDAGVYATPAAVDGTLYVRTHNALYAFRNTSQE